MPFTRDPLYPGFALVDVNKVPGARAVIRKPPTNFLLFARVTRTRGGKAVSVDLEGSGTADTREWCCRSCGRIFMEDYAARKHHSNMHSDGRE